MPRGVRIYAIGDDGQHEAGQILFINGKLVSSNRKSQLLQYILETAVPLPDESGTVTARDNPERFLESLHYQYRGSRIRASEVQEIDAPAGRRWSRLLVFALAAVALVAAFVWLALWWP